MPPVDLHGELWSAMTVAQKAIGALTHDKLIQSLPRSGIQWGLGVVEYYGADREFYEPQPVGRPAVIVPVVEDGDTIDLAAIDMVNQHVGRRLCHGRALGADAIEKARWGVCHLHLVRRPLDWLRGQPRAMKETLAWMRRVDHLRRHPHDALGDEEKSLPIEYVWLFDSRKTVAALDHVKRFTVDGFEFGERVRALFPPSERERVRIQP
jgi:hypothetical protein